ncbi:MAG TPA: mandelate racemase/muconate lactonizing enzyme family protein [Pyrinomonadaceae bacterium]|nr:mandelate racemase/muconate lactonizing enzyme family protein [Pyrinomonadaceae bacterium]
MRIDQARLFQVFPPPFAKEVYDATLGPFSEFPVGLLELRTADGAVGWGLVPAGRITVELLETKYLPALFASGVEPESFWRESLRQTRNLGPGLTYQTLFGIDMALWDLAAKREQTSLTKLLGGTRMVIDCYGSNGWTNFDLRELARSMVQLAERGFRTLKMKVGVKGGTAIAEDVERVKAVRKAIGPDIRLAVDANQVWDAAQALEFARGVEAQEILWFEEPIAAAAFPRIAQLAIESPVPLAGGESMWSCESFEAVVDSYRYLQPVAHTLGGISGYITVARLAAERSIPIASGGYSQLTCSLVAAAETGLTTEYLVPFMDRFAEIWAECPRIQNGQFVIPDVAGHGLTPDPGYVEKYSSSQHVFKNNGRN